MQSVGTCLCNIYADSAEPETALNCPVHGRQSHDCLEHLVLRSHEWTEPHGERCYQEWWECAECGETFTERELEALTTK